jgi:uncharacterized membrane protein YbhN (UPF0104 family)
VSEAAATAEPAPGPRLRVKRILTIVGVVLGLGFLSWLLGWDLRDWFRQLWDTVTGISLGYLLAGIVFQTLQTLFKAEAWYWILRYGYPDGGVGRKEVLACYAAATAMNGFLPANAGTFAMLLMFVAIIEGATFSGMLGAYVVQKIFFTLAGTFVYLYMFLSVPGAFDVSFGNVTSHPGLAIGIVLGGALLVYFLTRAFWSRLKARVKSGWAEAKDGGAILAEPKVYLKRSFLPSFLSWCCKLGVIAIFLAAFAIPVTFESVIWVSGSGSLANMVSFTPGSIGVTQATNALALQTCCDVPYNQAVDYSTGQQLIMTAWNQVVALVLVITVFGWVGGKQLVGQSYDEAKTRSADMKAQRAEKKAVKRAEKERLKAERRLAKQQGE